MPETVRITGKRKESKDTCTLEFVWDVPASPGQFVMVWIPGIDEIPMSLSGTGSTKSITVKNIGEATAALHKTNVGDYLRVRGPYGNGYGLGRNKKILAVMGGVGTASVLPAVKETGCDAVIGARNKDEIILYDEMKKYSENVWISTDDGSEGFHGNAVQLAKEKMASGNYDLVIGCGPEIMLYYLYLACKENGIECRLSLERYMKCGAGVCGSCVMDGQRVCMDGPVFGSEQLESLKDFGKRKRDECGRSVSLR
ncbi:MAG: dihydroorotate dehydrogenase electron transfer subunit [Candidatus Methanomethylophilaceae archaeon]|jgi:dihydroorotate dehydrogenase electron transfer subunit